MPTTLPQRKPSTRLERCGGALKCALVVSVLLLAALVQVTEQIYFSTPHHAAGHMAMILHDHR
jgi:hypothetical protein